MKSLDQIIKEHYEGKRLSESQLKQITENARVKKSPKRHLISFSIAASILVLLAYFLLIHPAINKNNIVKSYAEEIATNHLKQRPMEVITDDANLISSSLPKLNFKVNYDNRLASFGQLVGAKYCHVDDQIAAQLRLLDKANNKLTCYQFKQQHNIRFEKTITSQNVQVHLWTQDTLVFAVAETIQE